jgi:hypothetical protein
MTAAWARIRNPNAWIIAIAFIITCVAGFAWHGFRRGDRVLIPERYLGWIVIHYGINGQPRLPHEDGKNLINISPSGNVLTSSKRASGYGSDDYFFVDARGNKAKIHSEWNGCELQVCVSYFEFYSDPDVTIFFVGDRSDLTRFSRPAPPIF